jgi:hypothetical protein
MPTLREKIHELGNWHNKISMAAMVGRAALEEKDVADLSVSDRKKVFEKMFTTFKKIEQYIIGADGVVDDIKPFVYDKIGSETQIPAKSK